MPIKDIRLELQAREELSNLMKLATAEEIARLSQYVIDDRLNGANHKHCVYGAMTGSCYSTRSLDMMRECASAPFYRLNIFGEDEVVCNLARPCIDDEGNPLISDSGSSFTALEKCLSVDTFERKFRVSGWISEELRKKS